ncbi:MAG: hypothetical protein ABIA76_05370 [Candidatus Diapherotrites archaeon]
MAKPIRATPTLTGQEAIDFIGVMRRREKNSKLSNSDKELIKLIHENKKLFSV